MQFVLNTSALCTDGISHLYYNCVLHFIACNVYVCKIIRTG